MKVILSIILVVAFAAFLLQSKFMREIYDDFIDDKHVREAISKIN